MVIYHDAVEQVIAPGDWVVYAKSGYARIAKIMSIAPTGISNSIDSTLYQMTLMTAQGTRTFKRSCTFWHWNKNIPPRSYMVIRIDKPPALEEQLIETRLRR